MVMRPLQLLNFLSEDGRYIKGVAIVEGVTILDAVDRAWVYGINPGGHVLSVSVPPERVELAELYENRFLTLEEFYQAFNMDLPPRQEVA
jgi:hypothetical protein